jgi:hypothetical protein
MIFSLASCGRSDRLVPLYKPVTVNQLTNNKPVKFSFQIDDTRIDEYGAGAGKFPVFGRLFKAIAKAMANATIGKDGIDINLPSVTIDLSTLLKADFSTIDYITLDQLDVNIRDPRSKDNLKFLDSIEIWAKLHRPIDGLPVDQDGYTRMLYFNRGEHTLSCGDKCLILRSEKVNWKKFLLDNPSLELKPIITINSVPDSTMKLAGSIEYSIKFNVGF